ncbi:MAG: hypothetical protein UE295_07260 [Acutalibacteraceae bacterium]|nr:hypothetical protein [Acutalibacteraceae bacterium]
MATISLHKNKINNMPRLIDEVKKSVLNYKSELSNLKNKALGVNNSICDFDEIINTISTSTQTQEDKIEELETFHSNCDQFITDTVKIDSDVAAIVNQNKDDFYSKYSYLKPDNEKSGWEQFCDNLKKAGEWCKEHWKIIVTVALVIVAIVLICTGVGGVLGAMALGALFGAGIGGTVGGIISVISGKSFFEGFENGAFYGAISGIISGGMGFFMSSGGTAALTLVKSMTIGGVSGMGSSIISDLGDKFIKGENISWGDMALNAILNASICALFSGASYGISKGISHFLKNSSWLSNAKELFRFGKTGNQNYGVITGYTTSNPKGVTVNFANSAGKTAIRLEFDISRYLHYHVPKLFGTKAHVPLSPILDAIFGLLTSMFRD